MEDGLKRANYAAPSFHSAKMSYAIQSLSDRVDGLYRDASNWNAKDRTHRNRMAVQAANDHVGRVLELRGKSRAEMRQKLLENYNHAAYWENQFGEWALKNAFDNDYAKHVHQQAKEAYASALRELD